MKPGDTISFKIYSGHNVVQSAFSSPCSELSPGFASGAIYSGGSSNPDFFVVTVNDTKPIWAYCAYPNHCQGGMVFAANAPSSGNTFDAYKSAAGNTDKSTGATAALSGGVYSASAGGSSSGSSSSSASGSSSSGSATASSTASKSASGSSSSGSASSTAVAGGAGGNSTGGTGTTGGNSTGTGASGTTSSTKPSGTSAANAIEASQGVVTAVVFGLAGVMAWFM
ncbi:MAG: cupredoxin domain-containing protein [Terriglobus roseus]|nr:cupredoxin domain-containing protein [Terriglobus roseus]